MSCLDATFTLTPRSPVWQGNPPNESLLFCFGADFFPWSFDYSTLYGADSLYFDSSTASDPNVDYRQWPNRRHTARLEAYVNLGGYGNMKQLALIFGFNIPTAAGSGRVLVYTDSGPISDQTLASGDNQFLLEIQSLANPFYLYFVHVGGSWIFNGLSGYVV